ncbi:alkaline shock response membrane anchor protein AmaP [Lederbergia sp. NSJ-179]|uniref:alkaline shock response membrane anchor protein AmaP n=1 Tax=Lederbergia sp. NSJ-179 TaxID=2931402 RepID=UPI001FD32A30|nr:alkaline shock response membrane anchor protein AmaP [Lederbergia sp. NSJ-179]MCJ7842284.1 alkaline shock response membrane anchor protein AmaP [Lederbergia sp. NSJ-179]
MLSTREAESSHYQIAFSIICFLFSLFVPFILLYPIQELLYRPDDFFYFEPYFKAYILFMAMLVVISLIPIGNILIKPTKNFNRIIKYCILTIISILTIATVFLCFNHYKYMNKEGIYLNHFFSLKEEFTSWDEIEKVEQVMVNEDGVTRVDRIVFTLKDGFTLELDNSTRLSKAKNNVNTELQARGLKMENKLEDEE